MNDIMEDTEPFEHGGDCYFCGAKNPLKETRLLRDGRKELQCVHCYKAIETGLKVYAMQEL